MAVLDGCLPFDMLIPLVHVSCWRDGGGGGGGGVNLNGPKDYNFSNYASLADEEAALFTWVVG